MTEAEQQRIVGQVVSDLATAKRRLACLEAKAETLALQFGLLTNWLNGHFPTGVELQEGISVADALTLIAEIKDTKVQVARLDARREQLGV